MKKISNLIANNPMIGWIIFILTVAVVILVGILASSIVERRTEARLKKQTITPIAALEVNSEAWGQNFPRQFESHKKTAEGGFLSREGGNETIDSLARDPRMVVLWAGYAFSKDYNQARGHYNSVEDIRNTLRTNPATVATCWTCKSPDVVRIMNKVGKEQFYAGKWIELGHEITNPIGCLDCHNSQTMQLTITRPALKEAFERQDKKIEEATHQEMRSMVCAQCHVEYYFKKETNYLTFPWDKGMAVEDMEEYYDENHHVDWVHQLSKTPMLKAQHPDYELWQKGIHAQRGVSCADCHMPYRTEGGMKFTDHHIMSPLANISNSCQVCHRESEETLRQNVFERQEKIQELKIAAEDSLLKAHFEAKAAWDAGATEDEMKPILQLIRHSQWRWDYATASIGAAFHAPLEVARILGTSIDKSAQARIELSRVLNAHGVATPIAIPDVSTKEKAQQLIGVDTEKLIQEKREFLQKYIPSWDKGEAVN